VNGEWDGPLPKRGESQVHIGNGLGSFESEHGFFKSNLEGMDYSFGLSVHCCELLPKGASHLEIPL